MGDGVNKGDDVLPGCSLPHDASVFVRGDHYVDPAMGQLAVRASVLAKHKFKLLHSTDRLSSSVRSSVTVETPRICRQPPRTIIDVWIQ